MPTLLPRFVPRLRLTDDECARCEWCGTAVTAGMTIAFAPYCSRECQDAEPFDPSPKVRCPDTARFPNDLIGCGSTNVEQHPDGTFECRNCGLEWWTWPPS